LDGIFDANGNQTAGNLNIVGSDIDASKGCAYLGLAGGAV
jgi:hypothetical protein